MRAEWTLLPVRTCAWGVQNTKDHYLELHCTLEKRPGTVMQTRRQREHHSNTLIRRPRSTQHPRCTMFRTAYNRKHLRKNTSNPPKSMGWLHRAGEQSHPKCKWQHTYRNTRTTNERKPAQSMRHWHAEPPPRANHASSMPPSVPVERRASQLIHDPARDLCTFAQPWTEQRFKPIQTPRDLITPANAKRQAGGRRGSGSNLHRNSKLTLEVHQLTASCLP